MTSAFGNGSYQKPDPAELARKISAQAVYDRPKIKRFYTAVDVEETDQGHLLKLDGKPVKTPLKRSLVVPDASLGDALRQEWDVQGEHIHPQSMPLTKLSNTAIDRVADDRNSLIDEIVDYANSDLLCYRAEQPAKLVERQAAGWDPVLDWAANELGSAFTVMHGIMHKNQPDGTLQQVRAQVEDFGDFTLSGLHNAMTLSGSAVLALAAARGHLSAQRAWDLAHLDEDWQIEQWGPDEDEAERRVGRMADFLVSLRFLSLLS